MTYTVGQKVIYLLPIAPSPWGSAGEVKLKSVVKEISTDAAGVVWVRILPKDWPDLLPVRADDPKLYAA